MKSFTNAIKFLAKVIPCLHCPARLYRFWKKSPRLCFAAGSIFSKNLAGQGHGIDNSQKFNRVRKGHKYLIINSMNTNIVNLRTEKYDVYIGRAGRGQDGYFGNPFMLLAGQSRGTSLEKYRTYFSDRLKTDPEFRKRIYELKGKTLGCFCKPHPCHGDIIAEYLNSLKA